MLSKRPQGSLPGNTEPNPRGQVKAVTLRSGRELHSDTIRVPGVVKEQGVEVRQDRVTENDQATTQDKERSLIRRKIQERPRHQ